MLNRDDAAPDSLVPFRIVVAYEDLGMTLGQVLAHHDLLSLDMPMDCLADPKHRTATFTGMATRPIVTTLMAVAQGHDLSHVGCWT